MTGSWTKNWEAMKRTWATGVTDGSVGVIKNTGNGTVLGFNMQSLISTPLMPVYGGSTVSQGYVTVIFGGVETNPTTPGPDDYNIYGPVTSGISYDAVVNDDSVTYDAATGIARRTAKVTIRNTQANDVKIFGEWGLFAAVPYRSGNVTQNASVLLYRAKFDTPISLAQHESLTLTFTRGIELDVPNA